MREPTLPDAPAPRYRIERAGAGYRVVGEGLLVWEPTLGEAAERRDELESPGWRRPLQPALGGCLGPRAQGIVYGPVASRRLGRSLGLDLLPPGCRVCSFDCVYCEYAPARGGSLAPPSLESGACALREGRPAGAAPRWPTPVEVARALSSALPRAGPLDSVTISGHGEPTLHPRFGAVVAGVVAQVRRASPELPVRILSNGSRAGDASVRRALELLDERIVKLDADPERVCRPARRQSMHDVIAAIARLRDVTLQSCFVGGETSNTGKAALRAWIDLVAALRPRAVQIYSIDQPPGTGDVRPVAAAELEEIACLLRARTAIEARVFA